MKRFFYMILIIMFLLTGCKGKQDKTITCEDVYNAYIAYDEYAVLHVEEEGKNGLICYVKVEEEDGDDVYFDFYDSKEHAQENKRSYNIAVWLMGLVYGEARWVKTKTYNNIGYEYLDSSLIKPFNKLINS